MLGPSFSPRRTRIPGPTSSQSSPKRRPRCRASSTRRRSPERVRSSGLSSPSGLASAVDAVPERSVLTANARVPFDEHGACKTKRDANPARFDPTLNRALVLAHLSNLDPGPWQEATALQLTQAPSVLVGDPLHDHALAGTARAERALAQRPYLAGQGREGVAVGVELGASKKLEDAGLHALRDDVLESLSLVMHLVQAVAEHLH